MGYHLAIEWGASGAHVFLFLALCLTGFSGGCRTLRDRGINQPLNHARQLSLRGTDAIERQRYQDAELLFSEALKHSELDDRAHWGYAATLWERGERHAAIEHMEEALRLSVRSARSNPDYEIRLGEMYLEVGNYAKAREHAEAILATRRRHAGAWALLGHTHVAVKEWHIAMECYQHALLVQPDYPQVQLALAQVYRNVGKPQRALAVLDRMVDIRETAMHEPEALLNRGLALADLNRHDEAAEALVKASERLPIEKIDQHLQIVHAQHRIGELVAARLTLGKVREKYASSAEVQRLQSMLDLSFAHLNSPERSLQDPDWQPALMAQPVGVRENWIQR